MPPEFVRPDPDKLLERIQQDEQLATHGKLKIFLGYVAGVGKTYAMLEAAHQRMNEGVDVVVGYVETHGRKETEALITDLEVIPRQEVEYRGIRLTEMDLDAIIARHPQIVLVDELAHSNSAGLRHPKRFQDVEEILAAGIDVYTTVNIQHLESLSDVVQQITGVVVRERIPDRLVDEAYEIELIDLPTDELLKRLHDGKVYISDQAMRALEKFFRKGNLTALRELSLRRAADRVDSQMINYMQAESIPGPWPAGERILVCISSHPMGERLIRSGRRLADDLNAEWYVLFVETPQHLHMPLGNQVRVQKFLVLAEELGAKVASVTGDSVAETVIRFAKERNITKIVAGKPLWPRWYELWRGSVIDQIIRKSGTIDVHVVSDVTTSTPTSAAIITRSKRPAWRYLVATLFIGLATGIGMILDQYLEPTNLVMVYLSAVVITAVYMGRGPSILASFLSVLAFDFFFINPIFTFTVNDTQYILTFIGLLVVGLIISNSAALLRDQVVMMRNKENLTQSMFGLSRDLTSAVSLDQVMQISIRSVETVLNRDCAMIIGQNGQLESRQYSAGFSLNANERAVAEWSFKHSKPAGQGTDTLTAAAIRFAPLITSNDTVGVIGIKTRGDSNLLSNEERMLLDGLSNLIAQAIERVQFVDAAVQSRMLKDTEKLQTALLNSISHELRTPLSSITGVLTSLGESENAKNASRKLAYKTRVELINSATGQAKKLNRLVENLLSMTRIEAGGVHLNLTHCDLEDLLGSVVIQNPERKRDHRIDLEIPEGLPIVTCDSMLIAQVINNLLDNACKYSPEGTNILLGVTLRQDSFEIYVSDQGDGLPEEDLEKVFTKFYRSKAHKNVSGTGLGLSICKGIVEAHQGWIKATNNLDHGLTIRFGIPFAKETSHGR